MQFEGIYGLKTELKYPFKDWGGGGTLGRSDRSDQVGQGVVGAWSI